jgi:hypothetical protein
MEAARMSTIPYGFMRGESALVFETLLAGSEQKSDGATTSRVEQALAASFLHTFKLGLKECEVTEHFKNNRSDIIRFFKPSIQPTTSPTIGTKESTTSTAGIRTTATRGT